MPLKLEDPLPSYIPDQHNISDSAREVDRWISQIILKHLYKYGHAYRLETASDINGATAHQRKRKYINMGQFPDVSEYSNSSYGHHINLEGIPDPHSRGNGIQTDSTEWSLRTDGEYKLQNHTAPLESPNRKRVRRQSTIVQELSSLLTKSHNEIDTYSVATHPDKIMDF